jgi:hypothetical protein
MVMRRPREGMSMMVGSWRALARGLVLAASLVASAFALAQTQTQPQGATVAAPCAFKRLG